ncbi:MAG: sialidase family protein [Actinomycetota bacterium]|nr:sialidase family protein [Actinomycetota bacterium]
MSDLESEIAAQLRRRAEALPIDGQMHDRLVRRVRTHQRRQRAALVGGPVAVVAVAALAAALIVPSAGHQSRPRVIAAPAVHGPLKAAARRQPSPFSLSLVSPALAPGGGSNLRWVDFVSPTRGWALANMQGRMRVAHTSDGGLSWAVVGGPLPTSAGGPTPTRLVVVLAGNGLGTHVADLYAYAGTGHLGAGGARRLYVSLDRGSSWQVVEFPGPVLGVAPPLGPGGSVLGPRVSDGKLWALIGSASQGGQAGPSRLEISTDAGRTWKSTGSIPGRGNIGALARVSERSGFVVLESITGGRLSSSLLHTTGGGSSWQRLSDPCGSFPDQQLSAINAKHLWLACGSEPAGSLQAKSVYFSTDAARSWRQTTSVGLAKATSIGALGRSGYIIGLAALSDQEVWLALGRGPVDVTTDQGRTWRPAFSLPSGTGGAVQVTFVDATHGWALTPQGLWRTSNGVQWQSLSG